MIIGLRVYSDAVELIDLLTSAIYDASRNTPWETK
jgi:hypothetical protein